MEPVQENRSPITLAERFDRYRAEVKQIVMQGIEHPRFELKRSAKIARESLPDRLDFVKLIQGIANAHIAEERFVVIGADQKQRKFYNVENTDEFDPANLSQILSKYLDPQPRLEVFNNVRAETGECYVLIVISPDQLRPIVAITEGRSDKRTHFELGSIWIKKETSLQLAMRADLDEMYEAYIRRRVDEEAETRARRRFEHFRETLGAALTVTQPTVPSLDLLVGDKGRLTKSVEATISTGNTANLTMFVEMARELLVQKWDLLESEAASDIDTWIAQRAEIYRDEFVPALDSIVDIGLQIIKYNASPDWFGSVISGLMETFEACRMHEKAIMLRQRPSALAFARPAYDVYVGARALATYAVMRTRFRYLKEILPKYTRFITPEGISQVSVPLLFWPFSGVSALPDMRNGRNEALWNAHIRSAWGTYFGTNDKFLVAAAQLEFILEFNSYIFEGAQIPEVKEFQAKLGNKHFVFLPDFWTSRLDPVVTVAELFYEILARADDFPEEFPIEKPAMDLVFKRKNDRERLLFLGCFLKHLKLSQGQMMLQQNRFPFMFDWEGRLKAIVDECVRAEKVGQAKQQAS